MIKLINKNKKESSFRNQILFYEKKRKQYDPEFFDTSASTIYDKLNFIKSNIMNLERYREYNFKSLSNTTKMDAKIKHKKKREGD